MAGMEAEVRAAAAINWVGGEDGAGVALLPGLNGWEATRTLFAATIVARYSEAEAQGRSRSWTSRAPRAPRWGLSKRIGTSIGARIRSSIAGLGLGLAAGAPKTTGRMRRQCEKQLEMAMAMAMEMELRLRLRLRQLGKTRRCSCPRPWAGACRRGNSAWLVSRGTWWPRRRTPWQPLPPCRMCPARPARLSSGHEFQLPICPTDAAVPHDTSVSSLAMALLPRLRLRLAQPRAC